MSAVVPCDQSYDIKIRYELALESGQDAFNVTSLWLLALAGARG